MMFQKNKSADIYNLTKAEADMDENINALDMTGDEIAAKKPLGKKQGIMLMEAATLILVAVIAVYALSSGSRKAAQASDNYINYTVNTRDITLKLSGTGSLRPADSYTVTSLISADILSAPFEEGDIVAKDAVLYQLDSSDVSTSIEQAQIALAQSQRNYSQRANTLADLKIKATDAGEVIELLVERGDKVTIGQTVAKIRDSATMSLIVPFESGDAAGFFLGQSAEVTLDGTFERLSGIISKISAVEERLAGNMLVRNITVEVANPGGIAAGQAATVTIGGTAGGGSGTFAYKVQGSVTAEASGDVSAIHVKEGDVVSKNQLLITLKNDTLANDVANSGGSLRDSELSLQNRRDQLDNYTIKSPIAGTIIEKDYKEGDTLESGKILCTIFDLSYLTITLNVDELDIAKIEADKPVTITAEALPGRSYDGYVTKVNINGATKNGVTSYPVTIRIDETKGLLPGMNGQASIIVSSRSEAIAIPVAALARGNRVLVQKEGAAQSGLPTGFDWVQVNPGISDGEYIEIISGLQAGDVIAFVEEYIPSAEFDFESMRDAEQNGGPAGSTSEGMGGN